METLAELVARVLDINKLDIADDSSPETISSWDSFNSLMLIAELEKNFNVKFSIDEVTEIKHVRSIKDLLEKKGIIAL